MLIFSKRWIIATCFFTIGNLIYPSCMFILRFFITIIIYYYFSSSCLFYGMTFMCHTACFWYIFPAKLNGINGYILYRVMNIMNKGKESTLHLKLQQFILFNSDILSCRIFYHVYIHIFGGEILTIKVHPSVYHSQSPTYILPQIKLPRITNLLSYEGICVKIFALCFKTKSN